MKKQSKEIAQLSDYKLAKQVASTLEVFGDISISVNSTDTFRKYLRDFSYGKHFVTKTIDNQLKVTRLS